MAKTLPRRDSQKRCVWVSVYIVHELGNAGRIFFLFNNNNISAWKKSNRSFKKFIFAIFFLASPFPSFWTSNAAKSQIHVVGEWGGENVREHKTILYVEERRRDAI